MLFWPSLWESVPLAFCYSTSTQVSYDFQLAFFYFFPVTGDVASFSKCQKCLNIFEFVDTAIVLNNALTFLILFVANQCEDAQNLNRKQLLELVFN